MVPVQSKIQYVNCKKCYRCCLCEEGDTNPLFEVVKIWNANKISFGTN